MLSWFVLLQIISVVVEMLSTLQKCSEADQCDSWFLPVLIVVSRQLMTILFAVSFFFNGYLGCLKEWLLGLVFYVYVQSATDWNWMLSHNMTR